MHPFLDVQKLSDEEILNRLGRAYSYMNYQVSAGHNPTVNSIKEVIQTLEDERADRINRSMSAEHAKKYPDILAPIELGKLEDIRKML